MMTPLPASRAALSAPLALLLLGYFDFHVNFARIARGRLARNMDGVLALLGFIRGLDVQLGLLDFTRFPHLRLDCRCHSTVGRLNRGIERDVFLKVLVRIDCDLLRHRLAVLDGRLRRVQRTGQLEGAVWLSGFAAGSTLVAARGEDESSHHKSGVNDFHGNHPFLKNSISDVRQFSDELHGGKERATAVPMYGKRGSDPISPDTERSMFALHSVSGLNDNGACDQDLNK